MAELFNLIPLWGWIVMGVSGIVYVGFTIADICVNKAKEKKFKADMEEWKN